jgi:hypothetical protein
MHLVCKAAEIDPDVLAEHPKKGLIVARFKRDGDEVAPVEFRTLHGNPVEPTTAKRCVLS